MQLNSSNELFGKNILITGGTTGIGRACTVLFSSKGANVFIFGRHEKELNDALNDAKKKGGNVFGCKADVANYEDIKRVFQEFDDIYGQMDVLVNNAAIGAGSILEENFSEINYSIDVDLKGYLLCAKMAVERMKKHNSGHIVNIGSLSAMVKDPNSDLYVTSKAGIEGFSDSFRKKVNPDNIKVTLVEPGLVGTDLINESIQNQIKLEAASKMLKAEDIADCVLFAITRPVRCEIIKIEAKPLQQLI